VKDFDEARRERESYDRSFVIGGTQFTRRIAVAPERVLNWNKAGAGELELDEQGWLDLYDETVLALLEPGQEDKWAAVRSPDLEHPLTGTDLTNLIRWLFTEMAGRPTGRSSDSSPGPNGTATTSTDDSSSKLAEASPA
jgi:hypothetical protein